MLGHWEGLLNVTSDELMPLFGRRHGAILVPLPALWIRTVTEGHCRSNPIQSPALKSAMRGNASTHRCRRVLRSSIFLLALPSPAPFAVGIRIRRELARAESCHCRTRPVKRTRFRSVRMVSIRGRPGLRLSAARNVPVNTHTIAETRREPTYEIFERTTEAVERAIE